MHYILKKGTSAVNIRLSPLFSSGEKGVYPAQAAASWLRA